MSATWDPQHFDAQLRLVVTAKRLSGSKMAALTALALDNMQADTQMISLLYRTHKSLPAPNKVSSLYVFDSIARAAHRAKTKKGLVADLNSPSGNPATFLLRLDPILDGLVDDMLTHGPPEAKEKTRKVLDIWTKEATFPPATLARLTQDQSIASLPPAIRALLASAAQPPPPPPLDPALISQLANPQTPPFSPTRDLPPPPFSPTRPPRSRSATPPRDPRLARYERPDRRHSDVDRRDLDRRPDARYRRSLSPRDRRRPDRKDEFGRDLRSPTPPSLDSLDMAAFDFTDPAAWARLAAAWQHTHGRSPTQEEMMVFVHGESSSRARGRGRGFRGRARGGRGRGSGHVYSDAVVLDEYAAPPPTGPGSMKKIDGKWVWTRN